MDISLKKRRSLMKVKERNELIITLMEDYIKKATDGEYKDIAHPIRSDTRAKLQDMILDRYRTEILEEQQ